MRSTVLVLLAALFGLASADIWYVHPDSSLSSIQTALDLCRDGDTVLVGPGTYPGGYDWPSTADIALIGERGPDNTLIDGGGLRQGFDLFNVPGSGTLIRGFTITNCQGPFSGGIDVIQASLYLRDCRLVGNSGRTGGALHCEYGSLTVRQCVIEENGSTLYPPGGLDLGNGCNALVESCLVTRNSNGGICFSDGRNTVIRHCDIFGNSGEAVGYAGSGGQDATAERNWWGDASGPWHPSLNPDGRGDTVSDWVDFDPWLAAPVALAERPAPTASRPAPTASVVRSILNLTPDFCGARSDLALMDATGRRVIALKPGSNDISRLAPGVYFIRQSADNRAPATARRVVVAH